MFLVFLFAAWCVALARSVKLAHTLYGLSRRRVSLGQVVVGDSSEDTIASLALTGRIRGNEPNEREGGAESRRGGLLHLADSRFRYRWDECYAIAMWIKNLAILTLILSFAVVAYGFYPTWLYEFNDTNVPGSLALFRAVTLLSRRAAFGTVSSAAFYAVGIFFEGALRRRKAGWKRLHSQVLRDSTGGAASRLDMSSLSENPAERKL